MPNGGRRIIEDDEHDLLGRAQAGDATAFGELVVASRTSALRVATVVLGGPEGADDVVQDATARAWRAVGTVAGERGFRPWFLRIVANTARNDRRSRWRRSAMTVRLAARRTDTPADPEDAAVSDEQRQVVIHAINRLSPDDRLVIALRHFEQLTEAEMAEVLACPVGTVKSRLSRATSRLRRHLDLLDLRTVTT